MKDSLIQLVGYVAGFGGPGILAIAALDSSFLFLPLSVDLLMVALSANSGLTAIYYVTMAAAGSAAGTAIVYALARKGGEHGLSRFGRPKQIKVVQKKIQRNAGWALMVAACMPPPFPYTVFVAVAAASSFPGKKMLVLVATGRLLRYSAEAFLGILYGQRIVSFMQSSDAFYYSMLVLGLVSVLGTGASIAAWVKGK